MEEKLDLLAKHIQQYATITMFLVIFTMSLYSLIVIIFSSDRELWSLETVLKGVKIVILAICILIVAIPEGLPLAVSIAMALSVNKLKNDNILIKNVESVQTAALLHEVCVGKTGIITTGKLTVKKIQLFQDNTIHYAGENESGQNFFERQKMDEELKNLVIDAIVCNNDSRVEPNDETMQYDVKGQSMEVALANFLFDNQQDVQALFVDRNLKTPIVAQLPFCQYNKRKIVIRKVKGDETQVRVYVKGAPEEIVPSCIQTFIGDEASQLQEFEENEQNNILIKVAAKGMAEDGLKTISFAYKEIPYEDYFTDACTFGIESQEFREKIEEGLTYIGTIGLEDPIREGVDQAVQLIKHGVIKDKVDRSRGAIGNVNIRMVTGDHISTALYVAQEAGIITEDEQSVKGIFMTGEQFREAIGTYDKIWDESIQKYNFEFHDRQKFNDVKMTLRIIARATSEDKQLLVAGIR